MKKRLKNNRISKEDIYNIFFDMYENTNKQIIFLVTLLGIFVGAAIYVIVKMYLLMHAM